MKYYLQVSSDHLLQVLQHFDLISAMHVIQPLNYAFNCVKILKKINLHTREIGFVAIESGADNLINSLEESVVL